jgi:hypothetical protein
MSSDTNNTKSGTIDNIVQDSNVVIEDNKDRTLNIYVIDCYAETHSELIKRLLEVSGINAVVYPFSNQKEGIAAVKNLPNTYVLIGVEGNAVDTLTGKEPWASYSVNESVKKIKENNPNSKIIVLTGGKYSEQEAKNAGADGYLNKLKMVSRDESGRFGIAAVIDKVSEVKYK